MSRVRRNAAATALALAVLLLAGHAPHAGASPADSTHHRLLPHWMPLTLSAGLGGMTAPAEVRRQYQPGAGGALSLRAVVPSRLRFVARIGYHDLPGNPDLLSKGDFDSTGYRARAYDGGSAFTFLGGVETRLAGPFFVHALAGAGYHRAGEVVDLDIPVFGFLPPPYPDVPDRTGWGPAWGFGASYEFQPTPRDRLAIEAGFVTLRSGAGDLLRCVLVQIGYRVY